MALRIIGVVAFVCSGFVMGPNGKGCAVPPPPSGGGGNSPESTGGGGGYGGDASAPIGGSGGGGSQSGDQGGSAPRDAGAPNGQAPGSGSTQDSSGNPFAGQTLYVNPNSQAVRQANSNSDPNLQKIAKTAMATWIVDSSSVSNARQVASDARSKGQLAVFVLYNIPKRDCGSYSAGGASSASEYQGWIQNVTSAIGGGKAVAIVEPDGLANTDCLGGGDVQTRYSLIKQATYALAAANIPAYIDAGHSGWKSADDMASRLMQAGVEKARGFALNTANYDSNDAERQYGEAITYTISGQIGGDSKRAVIDTSRNAKGPASTWCNPSGQGTGIPSRAVVHDSTYSFVDAFYWIKAPGESDGTCNGGPQAGQFWTSRAIDLARNGLSQ